MMLSLQHHRTEEPKTTCSHYDTSAIGTGHLGGQRGNGTDVVKHNSFCCATDARKWFQLAS